MSTSVMVHMAHTEPNRPVSFFILEGGGAAYGVPNLYAMFDMVPEI